MQKEQWVELFKAIGLNEQTMWQWHKEFETRYPEEHQKFLEWLNIAEQESMEIRRKCQ